ncbi:MAG: hypothetical protein R3A45_02535 [Bdellovibrionota bacterium]
MQQLTKSYIKLSSKDQEQAFYRQFIETYVQTLDAFSIYASDKSKPKGIEQRKNQK